MNVGIHEIDDSYHHISFYPIQEGVLSLSGFLYPLDKRRIHIEEIYTTSNSLTEKKESFVWMKAAFYVYNPTGGSLCSMM